MKMIATKPLRYGGKQLDVGDPFETKTDRDAKLLRAIGKAENDGELREEQSEPDTATESSGRGKGHKAGGTYQRRDMRAKG
ncbi:hypothetical protein [Sphingomonas azotifigens]|uniref:hypothetical protein n=1 Tax=Sphingomonas azotifigens TaxID=330920 RepID=UPI0009FB986C|nr:hypothetical protein [Sphingomonas azotifigens]